MNYLEILDEYLFNLSYDINYRKHFSNGPFDRYSYEYQDYELNYEQHISETITFYENMHLKGLQKR